jgi:hypothetical protein
MSRAIVEVCAGTRLYSGAGRRAAYAVAVSGSLFSEGDPVEGVWCLNVLMRAVPPLMSDYGDFVGQRFATSGWC